MKHKIVRIIFFVLSGIAFAFGCLYSFRGHIMSYHVSFLVVDEAALNSMNSNIVPLFLTLMKVAGAGMMAIGLAAFIITLIPHKKEEAWSWWTLMMLFLASLGPMYFHTRLIAINIPHGMSKPPYQLTLVMLVLLAIGLVLSYPYGKKKMTKSKHSHSPDKE
jgi:hypothetical protein